MAGDGDAVGDGENSRRGFYVMKEEPFIHCYGIGPEHQPCMVRQHCLRHTALKGVSIHIPVNNRWYYCKDKGDQFVPIPKTADGDEIV